MLITYSDFATRYLSGPNPDAALSAAQPAYIELLIDEARGMLSEEFYGSLYKRAVLLYVADQIVSAGAATENGGFAPAGAISSMQVSDTGYSISYGGSGSSGGSGSAKSVYAAELASLRSRLALPTDLGGSFYDSTPVYYAIPSPAPAPVPTPSPSPTPAPTQRIPQVQTVNGAGVITGAQSIAIANIGASSGIVQGIGLLPGGSLSWTVVAGQDVLQAIAYDATGTTFMITTVS